MIGPERIIVLMDGEHLCTDCWIDRKDEGDPSLHVRTRWSGGTCSCCGAVIEDGYIIGETH